MKAFRKGGYSSAAAGGHGVNDLAWINTLPKAWKAKPLRAVAEYVVSNVDKVTADGEIPVRLCNYSDVYNNEFITLGLDFMQATATENEIAKFGLAAGDVIITKDSESWDDIGVPALVRESASDLVCGYHLALLRPRKQEVNGDFLFRCLQAKPVRVQLELAANGVTRFGIPKNDMGAATLPVPPLPTQRAIADYLDRETARIDALIAAKERVLALLAEKRRGLITRAVTRGLDPHAPLRDSGIPWLGEIPAHWEATRLKFVAEVRGGITIGQRYSTTDLVEVPYLRVANVQDGHLDLTEVATVTLPRADAAKSMLEVGDVLMNEGGDADKLGRGCVWRGEIAPCVHQNHVFAVRPRRILPDWLSTWTSTDSAKDFFESRAKQSTNLASISASNINELPIPMPPLDEQRAIVEHITEETAKIDALRAATERTIALLKERRSALIAAAVTGQIDVGGAA
jgi:type I restriction enzyme S subunit